MTILVQQNEKVVKSLQSADQLILIAEQINTWSDHFYKITSEWEDTSIAKD